MSLTDWSLRNLKPVVFLTAVLCLAGAAVYNTFPVSILPDVTFPRVVVIAEAGDRPMRRVEASVTRPIEEAVAQVPNVKRIRSKTSDGSTEVSIDFHDGTDVVLDEQLVMARINQIRSELPADTSIDVQRMNPTVFPVLGLTVNSNSLTQTELWSLANYTLKPRLARVDGVARVVVQGGRTPEIAVDVRPGDLAALGLSTDDVVAALSSGNIVKAVGNLDHRFKRYQVTVTGESKTLQDLKDTVVAEKEGNPVRVWQVADVHDAEADRLTVVSANGHESVLINLIRQPSANTVQMINGVKEELKRISLPHGVSVGVFYDQSVLVHEAIDSVRDAVLLGSVLSVFVLLLFLRDLRATVLTAAIIPMTLLITFLLMRLAGLTLNLMTLGALAVGIGLVIDDAIVVVECVFRNLTSGLALADAVRAATSQIAAPMVSSTVTTVVVFAPLAYLQGVSGAFFSALAITLTIALMVSLALALFISPSLSAAFLRSRNHHRQSRGRLLELYSAMLEKLLRHKWIVVPLFGAIALGTFIVASRLESGFMPTMDEGAFVLDYLSPPGTSLSESDRLLRKVDAILQETPEVETFSRRTGTELGFFITESNSGDYAVMLKPNRHRSIEDVISEIRSKIARDVPGLDVEFVQVLQDLIDDLAGSPEPIEVKVFGEDKAAIESIADDLADKLSKVKGLADVQSQAVTSNPQIEFQVDPGKAGRLGISAESVANQAEASLIGTVACQVMQGDRQIPVRVRLNKASRDTLAAVKQIGIETSHGRVHLEDLASVTMTQGSTQSSREDQRRLVSVSARLEGTDLGTAVRQVRRVLKGTVLPSGVTTVISGQYQSQQEAFRNLLAVLGAAVLLVFVVMLFQFRSFIAPTVILLLMPLSLFGASLGLWIAHTALNVSSFMGVIMLAGIVVKNGILLLDRAQHGVEQGLTSDQAVLEAGAQRLRPILMTTLTAILGLVPLALGLGAGAEMQKPLAVAVIGGLLVSTVLTLVIGPVLYAWLSQVRHQR